MKDVTAKDYLVIAGLFALVLLFVELFLLFAK
jgi:hypothetical protein